MDFIVTIDIGMNDTAWFSDVVLPEASYLERYDPLTIVDNKVFIRQPAIAPLYESKSGAVDLQGTRSTARTGRLLPVRG